MIKVTKILSVVSFCILVFKGNSLHELLKHKFLHVVPFLHSRPFALFWPSYDISYISVKPFTRKYIASLWAHRRKIDLAISFHAMLILLIKCGRVTMILWTLQFHSEWNYTVCWRLLEGGKEIQKSLKAPRSITFLCRWKESEVVGGSYTGTARHHFHCLSCITLQPVLRFKKIESLKMCCCWYSRKEHALMLRNNVTFLSTHSAF